MAKKLDGYLDRLIEANRIAKECAIFHYSAYWGTWSRRLYEAGRIRNDLTPEVSRFPLSSVIAVNLTPIPCCYDSSWAKDVIPIKFRAHCTADGRGDKNVAILPGDVLDMMRKNIGEELTDRLLGEDWLSLISIEKLCAYDPKHLGGGKTFEQIKR